MATSQDYNNRDYTVQCQMEDRFGSAITPFLESSSIRHLWRLSFLVNFFHGPLYVELAKRFDISRPEMQILYSLSLRENLLAQDISLVTGQPKNTISRAICQLLDKKYLHRKTNENDRRAKTLELTASGRSLLDQIEPNFIFRQEAMRSALTEEELLTFDTLLKKMVSKLPEWVDANIFDPMPQDNKDK